jgi:hypothetical protein
VVICAVTKTPFFLLRLMVPLGTSTAALTFFPRPLAFLAQQKTSLAVLLVVSPRWVKNRTFHHL